MDGYWKGDGLLEGRHREAAGTPFLRCDLAPGRQERREVLAGPQ